MASAHSLTADRGDFGRELALSRAAEVIRLRQLPDAVRAADVAALVRADLIPGLVVMLDRGYSFVLTPRAVRIGHLAALNPGRSTWVTVYRAICDDACTAIPRCLFRGGG